MLQQIDGPKWREKLPTISPIVTMPTQQKASPITQQATPTTQQATPTSVPSPKKPAQPSEDFLEEEFDKYKDQGKNFVQKVRVKIDFYLLPTKHRLCNNQMN